MARRLVCKTLSLGGTRSLASSIAAGARFGDVILLSGGIGAGKTRFATEYVRAYAGEPDLVVPSPTFLIDIVYAFGNRPAYVVIDVRRRAPV